MACTEAFVHVVPGFNLLLNELIVLQDIRGQGQNEQHPDRDFYVLLKGTLVVQLLTGA